MAQTISKRVAQQIVDTIKDVCHYDINFIDSKGIIFASTDSSRVGSFHEIGRQVILNSETIEVETDNSFFGTHKGVNIPFIHKGETTAVIGISGSPNEVRQYAYLAQKITSLILREHEIEVQSNNRKEQMNYIVRALTTGEQINHHYFMQFVTAYHADLQTSYQTILVQLNSRYNPANLFLIEQHIYQVFEQTASPFITFQYPNEYIMLIEADKLTSCIYLFQKLAADNPDILQIGIGSPSLLTKQKHSYETAQIALHSLSSSQNIALFDNLNLEILLGSVSKDSKDHFLHKTINKLDEKERLLLETYFDSNLSLKQTCEQLFVHKNTVQYQLDKIWQNCGYNPRCFRDAAVLYLGLRLNQMQ